MTNYFKQHINPDGTINPNYIDLLEVDKPIAAQEYGCFSFVSPEKILEQKNKFLFKEFIKNWDMHKSMEKISQFLNFISFKYKVSIDDINKDFEEFIKEEKENLINCSIEDEYQTFLDRNEDKLEGIFNKKNKFQTSVRGFKARGNFATQEEAELRAKLLRERDPSFDIFVGPVGTWLPWDPEAYKTGKTEYLEEELNQLMEEKIKNETCAKNAFDQRVKESKEKAIAENIKKAEKTGNKLTQMLDDSGNLVGVGNTQEQKLSENQNVTSDDIQKELFEGENVITGKTDNGRSLLKSDPFTNSN
jgi:hypothetical protein